MILSSSGEGGQQLKPPTSSTVDIYLPTAPWVVERSGQTNPKVHKLLRRNKYLREETSDHPSVGDIFYCIFSENTVTCYTSAAAMRN